jgi:hypothetical protein
LICLPFRKRIRDVFIGPAFSRVAHTVELTEGEGSVQLTSSFRQIVCKIDKNIFIL